MSETRGFTLIEVLIAIGIVLLVAGTFASLFLTETERNTCINQANSARDALDIARRNPNDVVLCRTAKSLVVEYNKDCKDKIGELPVPTCE